MGAGQTLCPVQDFAPCLRSARFLPLKKKVEPHFHKSVTNHNPGNYLRTHRKRSGLSQQELAAILGCEDGGAISRYEWSRSLPPLPLALALEVVYMVPVSQLFSGLHEAVTQGVEQRLASLEAALGSRSGKGSRAVITARKLQWLMERRNRTAIQ